MNEPLPMITLEIARKIIDVALAYARELKIRPMAFIVLDRGGQVIAYNREDFSGILRFEIAYAKAYGHEIVTQEQSNAAKKREIPIPDAAIQLGGIKTLTIYQLLTAHARPTFLFKP